MTSPNESGQTRIPDYEPKSPEERIMNQSIHFRLTHRVLITLRHWKGRGEIFTKPDNPMSLLIHNVPSILTESDKMLIPDWFSCPSSVLRIMNKDGSTNMVTYFFNDKGHSIKEEVNAKQEIVGSGTWSHMSPKDYDNAHQALVLAESGEFKINYPHPQ